jgi:hypothetical protein
VSKARGSHSIKLGANFIHEPVLDGAFASTAEQIVMYPSNPDCYIGPPGADCGGITAPLPFYDVAPSAQCNPEPSADSGITCTYTPSSDGSFSQNVQRLAVYGQDGWRIRHRLTVNYGVRYATTWGLFVGSGRTQGENPGYLTLKALAIPLVAGAPHDDHAQIAPRVGWAWTPGSRDTTVVRGGFGLYFDDLAQNGWATAFQAVNTTPGSCVDPVQNPGGAENAGCVPGDAAGGNANLIDARYRTPYAIHVSGGIQHAFSRGWAASADYIHEEGNHAYRAYSYTGGTNLFTPLLAAGDPNQATYVPDVNVFHSDNRSSYNALLVHVQGNVGRRLNLVANYTFSKAQTWGCVLGELFDYVNGVCDPLNAFGAGDYGPSGEDVRHRFVFAGSWRTLGGVELSTLTQAESARPFTITTADNSGRISINGVPTVLDQFRGTPYIQADVRVSRPVSLGERVTVIPFAEFFNLFNRNNPGANYVTDIATLPVPAGEAQSGNVTDVCTNADCSGTEPITSPKQLRVAGGALGDFFGPGTTVGIPFAAQLGVRATF